MRTRLVTVLLALITAFLVIPGAAATADEQGGESLHGQIGQPDDRDQGVEGILITVFQGEDEIDAVETDSDGMWEVELPEPGDYRVVVDQESVPSEFAVRETALLVDGEAEVEVAANQQRVVLIALERPGDSPGPSETTPSPEEEATEDDEASEEDVVAVEGVSGGFGERFVELTAAGVLVGLVIAISAIGLSLIFGTTQVINFSHGDMVTFGAMMALLFSTGAAGLGNSLLAIFAGLGAAILLGVFLEGRLNRTTLIVLQWASVFGGILLATLAIAIPFLDRFYPFPFSIFGKDYELWGLPFSLDLVLATGFFFILGNEFRQVTTENTFDNWLLLAGTGGVLLVLNILFPYEIDFNIRLYESFPVNTAEAILGILFVLALARQIELRTGWLASLLKYLGNISLIILLFHVPMQAFWAQKVNDVTGNFPMGIAVGFVMGVLGPILIYEIFIRYNPVASFWFGRKAEPPAEKEAEFPGVKAERTITAPANTRVAEIEKQ